MPLSQEIKELLLSKIESVGQSDVEQMRGVMGKMSEEQRAATIIQRKLRFTVENVKEKLEPYDYSMLQLSVERLTNTNPDGEESAFNESWTKWMESKPAS